MFRRRKRLPLQEVLAARPDPLPELEPELRPPPPRDTSIWWSDERGSPIIGNTPEILSTWAAVKAWVVRVVEEPDREGPDFIVSLAYEARGAIQQREVRRGFDMYHWAVGTPRHLAWWEQTILPGRPVTLLIGPGREVALYGDLELYVRRQGAYVWAAASGARAGDDQTHA